MANISPANARAGYELFRKSGCEVTKREVDDALAKMGYAPISDRMYRHYQNLCAEGYNRYLSINRFDVARANRPYEHLSTSSRYKYVPSGTGARVTFPRGRRLVEALGQVGRVGDTGLILEFHDSETVAALRRKGSRPRLGESVRVETVDPPVQYDGRVVDFAGTPKAVVIEVEFERLHSIAELSGRDAFPLTSYEFRLSSEPGATATVDLIGRQLFYLFEVVESARAVVNEAALLTKDARYAPVARVHRLRMSSPIHAALGVPEPVAAVLAAAFGLVMLAVEVERWRKKRLENAGLEIENKVKEAQAEFDAAAAELGTKVVKALGEQLKEGPPDPEKLTSLTDLVLSSRNLAEQDIRDARITNPP